MTPEEFLKKIDEKISKFESATKKAEETLSKLIKDSNPGKDPEDQEGNPGKDPEDQEGNPGKDPEDQEGNPGKDPFVEWFKSNE